MTLGHKNLRNSCSLCFAQWGSTWQLNHLLRQSSRGRRLKSSDHLQEALPVSPVRVFEIKCHLYTYKQTFDTMTEQKSNVLMGKYEVGKMLGQGTFAKVYHARNTKASESVAIKVIDKEKVMKVGLMDQIKREISVMKMVRHPNIVQLYEVMATKTKIYFVLEHVRGGELFNKVQRGRLKEDAARKYFQQLICAVDFCHSRGVYHRDLKPENLLLDENSNLKVSDFGLSALAECKRQDGLLHTTCGTPAYVAPEVINRKEDWESRVQMSRLVFYRCSEAFDLDCLTESKQQEAKKPCNLNAFDIISLSTGLDLSGMFEESEKKRESKFTSTSTASTIISKIEDIAKSLRLKLTKKDGGLLKMEGSKFGRKGVMGIDAEIFEVTPNFHLVELKKTNGDTLEYQKVLNQEMRPALKDIVWAWQASTWASKRRFT
ncbi:hypothetical protein QOZ80_UnG0728110 [Eleusine coracana subsp. coracana]|uniref:non-specific serine/threonine protein kinase n=1 Tax=Eleusine coracana subsp. coracana TaxID=191504 RepID=A0AAV9FWI5_ELECO|nr:hypothetical protein QOZ80_UnG0728110 [Eleusine coracana subsp. coracana]